MKGRAMGDSFDLDRYFERVGYRGRGTADTETLHALTAAHAQSIPFENIDVLLGRPIRLEAQALYRKLVVDHRGGYCFENNGLFLAVLDRLGFTVRPLGARVRLGVADRRVIPARTHMLLEVTLDDGRWITDVGVGAASLTRALRFAADREQQTPHDIRRIERDGGRWFHQIYRDGVWVDVYEFTEQMMPPVDRKVANWYASTHVDSHFTRDLTVALARPGGRRVTLSHDTLTLRAPDGSADKRKLADTGQLLGALRQYFGIDLPAGTPLKLVPEAI
jgi:N-hydroxyarylamine O-acetyltransferase